MILIRVSKNIFKTVKLLPYGRKQERHNKTEIRNMPE